MDCSPAEFDVNVVCPEDQGKRVSKKGPIGLDA